MYIVFFFFKQKTAYEIMPSLVGSEMCIRDSMQMTCRDRNRLAMQADILGAATLGIKNILCLTGDHMSFGNHPEARGVHDLDAINLIKMYKDMRDEKKFQCGDEMSVAPQLYIGCAENPFADPVSYTHLRAHETRHDLV